MSNSESSSSLPKGTIQEFKGKIEIAKTNVEAMDISIMSFTHGSLVGEQWRISSESINELAKVSIALTQLEMLFQTADLYWTEE